MIAHILSKNVAFLTFRFQWMMVTNETFRAKIQIAILFLVFAIMAVVVFYCYRWIKTRKTRGETEKTKEITLVNSPDRTLSAKCSKHCNLKWKIQDFTLETLIFRSRDGKDVWRARLKNSCQRVNVQLFPCCDWVFVQKWTLSYVVVTEKHSIRTTETAYNV